MPVAAVRPPSFQSTAPVLRPHAEHRLAVRRVRSVEQSLHSALDAMADETDFSGVVHVSRRGEPLYEHARGEADRAHGIANTLDTQFGIASGVKGFTALVVMSLVDEGVLGLDTPVRSVIEDELDQIDPAVTVYHLLSHTSGIGDYLDEEAPGDIDDYVLTRPVHELASTADYVPMLRGHPAKFAAGARFAYCNGGFVILALVAEIAGRSSFYDLVDGRVLQPAGMASTSFLRSDELPGTAAIGYLPAGDGWRTNHLHLPVRGSGDGGAYSTVGDFARFWPALFAGVILPRPVVDEMVRPHHDAPSDSRRYGLGFWLHPDRAIVMLEGLRRRRLVPVGVRAVVGAALHRDLEHLVRRLAPGEGARRVAGFGSAVFLALGRRVPPAQRDRPLLGSSACHGALGHEPELRQQRQLVVVAAMGADQPAPDRQGVTPADGYPLPGGLEGALRAFERARIRPGDRPLVDRRVAGLGLELVASGEIGEGGEEPLPVSDDLLAPPVLAGRLGEDAVLGEEHSDRVRVVVVDGGREAIGDLACL